jgi:hypothetical protein
MSGHTPGPWSWWDSCSFRRLSAKNDGDVMHAVIQRGDGHPDVHFPNGGYKGPDASLIAAAPELLEALKLAVRQNSHDMLMTGEELRICTAAIAKATGERA